MTTKKSQVLIKSKLILALSALTWFAVLTASAVRTPHPIVLADETVYLLTTKFGYFTQDFAGWGTIGQIPAQLYYWIYSFMAGPSIYFNAKVLNAAFLGATILPAYHAALIYLPRPWAIAFAVVVICEPISSFVRYFMPESLYYFGFWWVVYAALGPWRNSTRKMATLTGALVGTLCLVKPHALALLIGFGGFVMFRSGRNARPFASLACLALSFSAVRFGLGFALSGQLDFSISGPVYGSQVTLGHVSVSEMLFNSLGHAAALDVLAGLPLVIVMANLIRHTSRADSATHDLMLLAVCLLAATASMTVYFSCAAADLNPGGEPVTRLRGRYYAWILPLLMLAYGNLAMKRYEQPSLLSNQALTLFGLMTLLGLLALTALYETSVVDYPELAMLLRWPIGWGVFGGALLACITVTMLLRRLRFYNDEWRWVLPLAWWASVTLATSALLVAAPWAGRFAPTDVDRAMASSPLRELLGHDDGAVIGLQASPADTFRVLFHLASRSHWKIVPSDTTLSMADIPSGVNWFITLPGVAYMGPGNRTLVGPLQYVQLH